MALHHIIQHSIQAQHPSVHRTCVASSMTPFPMAMPIKLIFTSSGALSIRLGDGEEVRGGRKEGKRWCDIMYTCCVLEGVKRAGEQGGKKMRRNKWKAENEEVKFKGTCICKC
jgi:hypothetical protein